MSQLARGVDFELLLKLDVLPSRHGGRSVCVLTESCAGEPYAMTGHKVGVRTDEELDLVRQGGETFCTVRWWHARIIA